MPSEPTVLEYALVVTTASSSSRTSSELRVKYFIDGEMRSTSITMTVADFAKMVEDQEDIISFVKSQGAFQT